MKSEPDEEVFLILSMERTAEGKTCVWWRPNGNGYTTTIGEAGRYTREAAIACSDPPHHLAVPCSAIDIPAARAKAFAKKALSESRWRGPPPRPALASSFTCPTCGMTSYHPDDVRERFCSKCHKVATP